LIPFDETKGFEKDCNRFYGERFEIVGPIFLVFAAQGLVTILGGGGALDGKETFGVKTRYFSQMHEASFSPQAGEGFVPTTTESAARAGQTRFGKRWLAALRPSATLSFALAALAIASSIAVAIAIGYLHWPPEKEQPTLTVNEADLNFGRVWATHQFPWKLHVTNNSSQPVNIERIEASCICTIVGPNRVIVPPHSTAEVAVNINLVGAVHHKPALEPQPFEVHFQPLIVGATPGSVVWTLRGEVVSAIEKLPASLDFGEWVEGNTESPPRSAQVLLAHGKDKIEIDLETQEVTVRMDRNEENPALRSMELAFSQEPTPGRFRLPAMVRVFGPNGEPKGRYSFHLVGRVVEDIYIDPPSLAFGIVEPGARVGGTLTINSHSGKLFEVLDIKAQGKGLSAESAETGFGPPYRIHVHYHAPVGGPADKVLAVSIHIREEGGIDRFQYVYPTVHILAPQDARADEVVASHP
jgi:hypothetical protein